MLCSRKAIWGLMEWIRYKEGLCLFYCLTFLWNPHLLTRHEVSNSEGTLEEEGSPKQKCHRPSKCVISIVLHAGYGSIYCMAAYKISSRQTTKTKEHLIMASWSSLPSPSRSDHCSWHIHVLCDLFQFSRPREDTLGLTQPQQSKFVSLTSQTVNGVTLLHLNKNHEQVGETFSVLTSLRSWMPRAFQSLGL